jgi:hypothetical protein
LKIAAIVVSSRKWEVAHDHGSRAEGAGAGLQRRGDAQEVFRVAGGGEVSTGLPAVPHRGDAGVPARLAAIDRARRYAALATDSGGRPYLSLVAFALAPGGAAVLFATPRDSRKYRNLRRNPRVSLLLDTRGERDRDYASAEAITVSGRARVLRAGSLWWLEAGRTLRAKHPALAAFLGAATTALVSVEIEEAVHVGGFQRVTAWRPAL